MKTEWLHIACILCLCLLTLLVEVNAAKSKSKPKAKQGRETREKKAGKQDKSSNQIKAVQRELQKTQKELDELRVDVTKLASELQSGFEKEPPCPNNVPGFYYSDVTGSCYHLEPQNIFANWSEAKAICQSLRPESHIVSIETEEEQRYLTNKWKNERGIGSLCRFWTSGKAMVGDWRWASSGVLLNDTYTNWLPAVAHDDPRFACMAVFSNEAYLWSAVACWAPHMVTCEMTP